MVEKSKRVNVEISTETYQGLCGIKDFLEETFNCKVSFDKVFKIVLSPKMCDWSEVFNRNQKPTEYAT